MPCNSDHMNPSKLELECGRLECLIEEAKSGMHVDTQSDLWQGYDPAYYGHNELQLKSRADKLTQALCTSCRGGTPAGMTKCSLELQLWWRDHQRADAARISRETRKTEEDQLRRSALKKLTPQERDALGFGGMVS